MRQYETPWVTTEALVLAYMWSQLGTNPENEYALINRGRWFCWGWKNGVALVFNHLTLFVVSGGCVYSFTSSAGSEPFCSWQSSWDKALGILVMDIPDDWAIKWMLLGDSKWGRGDNRWGVSGVLEAHLPGAGGLPELQFPHLKSEAQNTFAVHKFREQTRSSSQDSFIKNKVSCSKKFFFSQQHSIYKNKMNLDVSFGKGSLITLRQLVAQFSIALWSNVFFAIGKIFLQGTVPWLMVKFLG